MKRHRSTPKLTEHDLTKVDQDGFLIIENVLTPSEVKKLNRAADELYARYGGDASSGRLEVRNCVAHHPALLAMVDHPVLLPAIVALLGPDIKVRTSELDIRPPVSRTSVKFKVGKGPWGKPERWHIDGPLSGYPTVDGIVPMMEVRAGYLLSDHRRPNSGALYLVRGSHRRDYHQLADSALPIKRKEIIRAEGPPGSAILFRTGVWHCASPNLSRTTRKVLYFAYTYRWIHGSDYIAQDRKLLNHCSPVQRQLLGAPAQPGRHVLGPEPFTTPRSIFWFTEPEDIPLAALAQKSPQKE